MRWLLFILTYLFLSGCAPHAASDEARKTSQSPKQIALTYDDAPRKHGQRFTGSDRTDALIAQLKTAQTGPVAFFVTTQGLSRADGADRIRRYDAAGHRIANHSHTHPWASRVQVKTYLADIDQATAALDGLGPLAHRRPWFRFPFLDEGGYGDADVATARRNQLRDGLKTRGLRNGYVTVDTFDWYLEALWQRALRDGKTVDRKALGQVYADMVVDAAEHFDAMALDVLDRRPAQILLLHENDLAAAYTIEMVTALRAAGWTIIDPDMAYQDPIADESLQTLFAGMGRVAAIAHEGGKRGAEYFDHWSADEAGIEARVARANVFGD